MRSFLASAVLILTCFIAADRAVADGSPERNKGLRVLSWNISGDAFVSQEQAFSRLLHWAKPDVVLLDEVAPTASREDLENHLAALSPGGEVTWNISVGKSGGRQRTIVAAREPLALLPAFEAVVAYSEADQRELLKKMSPRDRSNPNWSMDGGIPVNGAVIETGEGRLLVIIADLQCCGDGPDSWQETRRRVEAREIRSLIGDILRENDVDGVVLAGDFNMVNSTFPLALLLGPYPRPHAGLIPAEVYHPDGETTWTWDGRGTPFPSNVLDYQLYSPHSLAMESGLVLDSERSAPELRRIFGLDPDTSTLTGRHRPIVVEYSWK